MGRTHGYQPDSDEYHDPAMTSVQRRNLEDEDKLRILHHCCGRLESIDKEEDTSMVDFLTSCYG